MPYDVAKDFAPVTLVTTVPNAGGFGQCSDQGHERNWWRSKAEPGNSILLRPASAACPLAGELFNDSQNRHRAHTYQARRPRSNDLLGQQVQMAFLDLPVLLPHIKAGLLTGARRAATRPLT